jgi:hypothetical protein
MAAYERAPFHDTNENNDNGEELSAETSSKTKSTGPLDRAVEKNVMRKYQNLPSFAKLSSSKTPAETLQVGQVHLYL